MYTVRILKAASRELARFDKPIAMRMVARIRWLAENLDDAKPKALKGELAGLYKLREGDYRIIYEIIRKEKAIVAKSTRRRNSRRLAGASPLHPHRQSGHHEQHFVRCRRQALIGPPERIPVGAPQRVRRNQPQPHLI